jgi:hypothetical protein
MRKSIVIMAIAAGACGGPAAPTSTAPSDRIELATGAYEFHALHRAPPPECGQTDSSYAQISVQVTVSHEGSAWFARAASPADGDLEIRFSDSGGPVFKLTNEGGELTSVPVLVTIRGTGIEAATSGHSRVAFDVAPIHATIPTEGRVWTGWLPASLSSLASVAGTMTFWSSATSASCQVAAEWYVSRSAGSR